MTTTFSEQGSCGHRAQIQEHVDASMFMHHISRHVFGGILSSFLACEKNTLEHNTTQTVKCSLLNCADKCHLSFLTETSFFPFLPACMPASKTSCGCSRVQLNTCFACFSCSNPHLRPKENQILTANNAILTPGGHG